MFPVTDNGNKSLSFSTENQFEDELVEMPSLEIFK